MFSYVNEIAAIGTSFFMMAIATLWYSEYLFQKPWQKAVRLTDEDLAAASEHTKRNAVLSFVSYVVVVYLIALAVGYAQVYGLSAQKMAIALSVGFAAFVSGLAIWEQRSLVYLAITVGFSTVFILGSTYLLLHWPW